jgi:uncharacterized membrane protein YphA (DoxX/SURF4 family)
VEEELMRELSIVIQLVIALGIVNVWILRPGKPTPWRPDGASNMKEEFSKYGLPDWVRSAVGFAKLTLAALLVVGIWYPPVATGAAVAMALLMLAAVIAHVRAGDPPQRSLPAFTMLLLSAFVVYANGLS